MKKIFTLLAVFIMVTGGFVAYAQDEATLDFGASAEKQLIGGLLAPGEKYSFPILLDRGAGGVQLTAEDMKSYQLRLDFPRGKQTLKEGKISTRGGLVFFDVAIEDGFPVAQTELTFKLNLVNKEGSGIVATVEEEFSTGFLVSDDDSLLLLERGDSIEVDRDRPIYTEKQLERVEKLNDYKKITFRGDEWQVAANATGIGNVNMLYSMKPMKELLTAYPNYDFKTISFPARPKFMGYATLTLDVTDIEMAFNQNFYVYSYENGVLTGIEFVYNDAFGTLSIDTPQLGQFVICDHDIQSGYKPS